jgi:serine/threonine-protein kinase
MTSPHGGSRLGTRFGPYQLNSLIGVGGMGEVYRAYDTVKDRTVAVKVLRAEMACDPNYQERFRRESRVAARLQEPHVIPVHDFGDIDGVLYIDMRLVEGGSLKDELRANGPLASSRATSIVAQVGAALDAAHTDGLVHRDIKPENVLLTQDDFAYLVDFGIAHGEGDASMTMTGLIIGSCAYMSAERFSGGHVGPPADVYSLTCLLYEALTGRPPFETGDLRQLMTAHLFSPPPRPSIMRRGIDRAFDDVIAKGMAKRPEDRFASAGELARAARAATSGGPVPPAAAALAGPAPRPPVPPPSTRQFSAVYPNPGATGYTPYPPPQPPAVGDARFGRSHLALLIVTIALFAVAVVLAVELMSGTKQNAAPPQTTAALPPSVSTQTETVTPTTSTSTSPTTRAAALPGVTGADSQGFIGQSARCDSGSTLAAAIRTSQSLAVVCQTSPGSYTYHGQRLSDGANIALANASADGGGFDVTNPADGAHYEVRPDHLTISSNGHVDSYEPALQYAAGPPG